MKTKKQKQANRLTLIAALLLVIQFMALAAIWQENRVLRDAVEAAGTYAFGEDPFETELIADPAEKRLYLPGLDAFLPMTLETKDLYYRITDARGGGTTDLVFSSSLNLGASDECNDLVRMEIGATESKPRGGETAKEPFSLRDGRTVHTYLPENAASCQMLPVTPDLAEVLVRQMQSY